MITVFFQQKGHCVLSFQSLYKIDHNPIYFLIYWDENQKFGTGLTVTLLFKMGNSFQE